MCICFTGTGSQKLGENDGKERGAAKITAIPTIRQNAVSLPICALYHFFASTYLSARPDHG